MRRPVLACALALVLAVAGCSGGPGGDAAGGTSTGTITPAPVPSASPTATPDTLPPGVERSGVEDAWKLTTVHRGILARENHTVRIEQVTRYPNGTVRWRRTRVARVDGERSHAVVVQEGRPALHDLPYPDADRIELYVTDSRVHAAVTRDGATEYRRYPRGIDHRRDLYMLLSAVETRVAWKVRREGTTLYRIEATDDPAAHRFQYVERVREARNVTLGMLVDPRGVVRARRFAYTTTIDGQTVRYERTVRVSALGETTVERPPWVDRWNGTDGGTDERETATATGGAATAP